MSDGTPINTGWYVTVDDDGQGQRIKCNICHHRVEFPGDFWGMEYDTNGNGAFRNVFVDGYFCPFD